MHSRWLAGWLAGWLALQDIDEAQLDKLFLLKALNSITEHFRRIAPDGTQPNLNTGIMKGFELIIPPLELQQKFSGIVGAVRREKLASLKAEEKLVVFWESLQGCFF